MTVLLPVNTSEAAIAGVLAPMFIILSLTLRYGTARQCAASRHCEEQSDEAIQQKPKNWIAARPLRRSQ